jgi:hypothetical protein
MVMQISVVACLGPRQVQEWELQLPEGATAAQALHQAHKPNFRGIGFVVKHRFSTKNFPHRNPIKPADKFAVTANFYAVRMTLAV